MVTNEFLTKPQLHALEAAIAKARAQPGLHKEELSDGEVYAYRTPRDIHWIVNGGLDGGNVAEGTVPLVKPTVSLPPAHGRPADRLETSGLYRLAAAPASVTHSGIASEPAHRIQSRTKKKPRHKGLRLISLVRNLNTAIVVMNDWEKQSPQLATPQHSPSAVTKKPRLAEDAAKVACLTATPRETFLLAVVINA